MEISYEESNVRKDLILSGLLKEVVVHLISVWGMAVMWCAKENQIKQILLGS